ncbi:MAG TPA: iron ABC transporter permease [Burkholderiaceae bacterium]|nr:iron ABC transporter permease [Burkholderiaceae bacterium]
MTTATSARAPFARSWLDRLGGGAIVVFAALIALPVLGVLLNVLSAPQSAETLRHLATTVLPATVLDSLLLAVTVGIGAAAVGTACAWLTSVYTFPGRGVLSIALLLPLAMPAYVMAYAYTDLLQFAGPVQSWLRDTFNLAPRGYWFPEVRSLPGAALMFIFVLYPYVYLLARASFLERSQTMLDAARTLGCTPWQAFVRVGMPLARPAVAAGAALAVMETLADYGTVAYFGVNTFTTAIYRAWFSLGDRAAAAQLASALLGFVALLVWCEAQSRGNARFYAVGQSIKGPSPKRLTGWRVAAAWAACMTPVVLGFVLPVVTLIALLARSDISLDPRLLSWVRNSVVLAASTAALAAVLAVVLAHIARQRSTPLQRAAMRIAELGYAVPGAIIAVGILIPLAWFDNAIDAWAERWLGVNLGLVFTGSAIALVYAYLVRFYAVSAQTIEAGYAKITPAMEHSARSLGLRPWQVLRRVHVPLLARSVAAATLLVFVDVMKELPATLVIRPFDFDTLAVIANQFAADERLAESAVPALAIVAAGIGPVALLARAMRRR